MGRRAEGAGPRGWGPGVQRISLPHTKNDVRKAAPPTCLHRARGPGQLALPPPGCCARNADAAPEDPSLPPLAQSHRATAGGCIPIKPRKLLHNTAVDQPRPAQIPHNQTPSKVSVISRQPAAPPQAGKRRRLTVLCRQEGHSHRHLTHTHKQKRRRNKRVLSSPTWLF